MAQGKKTFIFYSDWINMVREMPNTDAGELLKHILSYVNDEDPTTENLLVKMAFGHMKPMLKEDLDKWEVIREKRKEAGKKGGQANAKQNQANAKQVEAVNDNVNVNVNVNDNKKEERFNIFWNKYPNKVGKKDALKKWMKLSNENIDKIESTIDSFIKYKPFKDYNHPNPTTYLNQERWNDEIEKPKNSNPFSNIKKSVPYVR